MSEQQLDFQPSVAVISGPHLGEAQQSEPREVNNEPFAYFQFNEGWDMWDQVAHEHRHEEGVVPAYRLPTTLDAEAFARGLEAAAKVVDDYETFTGDPSDDAVRDVMAVKLAEVIRALIPATSA